MMAEHSGVNSPIVPATASLASNNMSDVLELNCWLLGEDPPPIFIVEIAKAKTIYGLKRAGIKDMKTVFDGIDADHLKLWKVCR